MKTLNEFINENNSINENKFTDMVKGMFDKVGDFIDKLMTDENSLHIIKFYEDDWAKMKKDLLKNKSIHIIPNEGDLGATEEIWLAGEFEDKKGEKFVGLKYLGQFNVESDELCFVMALTDVADAKYFE